MDSTVSVNDLKGDERRSHWRQVLEDQRSSGMTAAAYCRAKGISGWRFGYWRKALSDENPSAQSGESSFVELRGDSRAAGVFIEAGRWRVRVEPGFDAATLLRVIEALTSP